MPVNVGGGFRPPPTLTCGVPPRLPSPLHCSPGVPILTSIFLKKMFRQIFKNVMSKNFASKTFFKCLRNLPNRCHNLPDGVMMRGMGDPRTSPGGGWPPLRPSRTTLGPCGLLAAITLKKRGIPFVVLERAPYDAQGRSVIDGAASRGNAPRHTG